MGESGLLKEIFRRSPAAPSGEIWVGDDAALIRSPGTRLLFTTDLLVENVDFDLELSSGADIGYKAVAVNVSDVAAMGGTPEYGLATLSLRSDVTEDLVRDILDGLEEAARRWGLRLVGGDISSGRDIAVSVSLIGRSPEHPVVRSGAREGELIFVTGTLGASAGGLEALRAGLQGRDSGVDGMIRRHLRPEPRVEEGRKLAEAGVSAMIDVSDGLGLDLSRVMEASGTGCRIQPEAVPADPALETLGAMIEEGRAPFDLAFSGGEDFELLFTCSADVVKSVEASLAELGTEYNEIGRVTGSGLYLGDERLEERELGWDHLRKR